MKLTRHSQKRGPSLWQGIAVAVVLAAGAAIALPGLGILIGSWWAFKVVAVSIAGAYCAHLIHTSGDRTTILVTASLWLAAAAVLLFAATSTTGVLVALLVMIWLSRAAYHRAGAFDSVADLGLLGLGAVAATGALLHTGSAFVSVWTFFLIQALHSKIASPRPAVAAGAVTHERRFNQALRTAEAALRRIHQQPTL